KIIIFEGTFKTTTFINRLAKGLSEKHQVYIFGFNNTVKDKIPTVKYVGLGSSEHLINLVVQSKLLALKLFLKTGNLLPFLKTIKNISTFNRKQLQQDNFNNALQLIKPDIVHVQWQSLVPWCENALENKKYNFVLSQRGYQSNVRPFVNQENFNYLQNWYPKFNGFHSVSKAISKQGDAIFNSDEKIDKVVYSGFNFSNLPFNKNYKKQETLQLLSVGRPHWVKGYSEALLACKLLKEKNIPFQYKILGASIRHEELMYMIYDLELQKQVQLLPKVEQKVVYNMMQDASVLILPSIIEGLPNVLIEAMALGLPVITTKCGGVEELVNPKIGWLSSPYNPNDLFNAIINFYETPIDQIHEKRVAARKKVEQQHAVQKMIHDIESLYFKVLT
ncbi:MAG: glycosyltransferase family 4 protein, partial [Flavobacteriales bacterium]